MAVLAAVGVTLLERLALLSLGRGLILYGSLLAGIVYWMYAGEISPAPSIEDKSMTVIATISEPVRHGYGRSMMTLSKIEWSDDVVSTSRPERVRMTWRDPNRTFYQGDRVRVVAKLHSPTGLANPGGFDYAAYLAHKRIEAVASVSGPEKVTLVSSPFSWSWNGLWHRADEWRNRVREAALATLSGPALGVFLGIVIGESGYLSATVRDIFMVTGTVHILSISGSHLGLIAFLTFLLAKAACRYLPAAWLLALSRRIIPSRLAAIITTVPVCFYTLLAGAEVATVRSLVMILIFLTAVWLGREHDLLPALALAALLIVVHEPHAIFDISFQLSFTSVLAIALVVRWKHMEPASIPWPSRWSKVISWLRDYAQMTTAVTVATLPLVAYHFNQIAWLGLIGNIVILPIAGLLLVPLGLGSAVWTLISGNDYLAGGEGIRLLVEVMMMSMQWLGRIPGAEWHVASPAVLAIWVFYALLLLGIALRSQALPRTVCAVGMAGIIAWWAWSPREAHGDVLRVTFLDVGQGDASVVELPDGQVVLIDAGGSYDTLDMGRAVIGPFLWDRGIKRLDHVIATHPQLDHVGGLPWVVHSFEVGRYWGNQVTREERFYDRLQGALRERGLVEEKGQAGRMVVDGACRMEFLNTLENAERAVVRAHLVSSGKFLNNLSVVTKISCGAHSFLFTGDAEVEALNRMVMTGNVSSTEVLKVPHHGSSGSVDDEWLDHVRPDIAVISVGKRNPYGHPASKTLAAYEAVGARIYRTDVDGAISITAHVASPGIEIHTARELALKMVRLDASWPKTEQSNLRRLWAQWSGNLISTL
jgi:competence protein ComEC